MNLWIAKLSDKNILLKTAILTLILFIALRSFDVPLHTSVAPSGIVSFEFAKNIETANEILESWDVTAKTNAGLSLGIDFLFLFAYSIFFSTACFLVANKYFNKYPKIFKIGLFFSYLLLIAGVFDAIENIALIKLLLGSNDSVNSLIAYYFALTKFTLIVLGLLYIILGFTFGFTIKQSDGK